MHRRSSVKATAKSAVAAQNLRSGVLSADATTMRPPRDRIPPLEKGRRKHNWRYTPDAALSATTVVLERHRPGRGYRHILSKSDVERFIALLPDWDELSRGLEAIVLLAGNPEYQGWCGPDWIGICGWSVRWWSAPR